MSNRDPQAAKARNGIKQSVFVVTPGARLAMQTALALQEADLLLSFLTGYYFKTNGILARGIRYLPTPLSVKLVQQLKRRHLSGLREDLVRGLPQVELPYILLNRTKLQESIGKRLSDWRNGQLFKTYRKAIRKYSPKAVICCDGWGKQVFAACPKDRVLRILDQNTGHITAMAKTLREEQSLHPDMADSITPFSDQFIEECTEEALSADAIFVSSEFAKNSLLDIGVSADCIYHIPYAADIERFRPQEKEPSSIVRFLFVGLIGQRKGVKYLLEAFKKLKLPGAELELVGVPLGSGRGLLPYRDLFIHTPSVPYQEIHHCFQRADIFVMPTLHESGVLAIHEALASGLPVITTPNAGSIVRDGEEGYIVPIRDVDALAEKMELLFRDRELRIRLGGQARKRAEQFTWERYRKRIGETVAQLLKQNQ